jgi:hypothetical protein
MNVSEKIKARIADLRNVLKNQDYAGEYNDYGNGYNSGEGHAIETEIDFLIEILDEIERKALKEEGYNV